MPGNPSGDSGFEPRHAQDLSAGKAYQEKQRRSVYLAHFKAGEKPRLELRACQGSYQLI